MFKKFLSVLLAVMMVVSVLAVGVVSTSAVTTDGFTPDPTKLYFDVDGTGWAVGAKDKIAFYMAGGDFDTEANTTQPLDWGAKKLQGKAVAGETGVFEFTPTSVAGKNGDNYSFTPGVQYKIIFALVQSNNWKLQTCSLFFTTDCFGHVAYSDGTDMENDVDSTKVSKTVYWRGIDPEVNGPALCITSIGNVVGSCVEQGKTKESLFTEFISEPKDDFGGKTGLENARYYTVEQAKTKTEQEMIDDIGNALGLTKDYVAQAFTDTGVETAWTEADSTLPAGGSAHVHTPGEPVQENVNPASCKEAGSYDEVVYCSECGEELSRETKTIDKLAHTPGETKQENVNPASCKEAGSYDEVLYCSECGEVISSTPKTIDKLPHTPGETKQENVNPASCKEAGSYDEVLYCSECGEVISSTPKTIDKLAHTPSEPVQDMMAGYPATCTEKGLKVMVTYCTECGDEISREEIEIDMIAHTLEFVPEVPVEGNKNGMMAHYKCSECGKLFSDSTGAVEVAKKDLIIKSENSRGDVDNNGELESIDVTLLQRWLVEYPVEIDEVAADADNDGEIDIIDATLMQRVLANMITFEKWDELHPKEA